MQEHIHVAKRSRIIKQSVFIWFNVALQIGFNAFAASIHWTTDTLFVILLINLVLGSLTVSGIRLFLKYYKHSVGKQFVITYDSLKFVDCKTGESTVIKSSDIEKIYLVETRRTSRLPWSHYEYFKFVDKTGKEIIVTSNIMNICDFWLDTLTRKVNSDRLIREVKTYPII